MQVLHLQLHPLPFLVLRQGLTELPKWDSGILLPQPPECCDYEHVPQEASQAFQSFTWTSATLGSTSEVASLHVQVFKCVYTYNSILTSALKKCSSTKVLLGNLMSTGPPALWAWGLLILSGSSDSFLVRDTADLGERTRVLKLLQTCDRTVT